MGSDDSSSKSGNATPDGDSSSRSPSRPAVPSSRPAYISEDDSSSNQETSRAPRPGPSSGEAVSGRGRRKNAARRYVANNSASDANKPPASNSAASQVNKKDSRRFVSIRLLCSCYPVDS